MNHKGTRMFKDGEDQHRFNQSLFKYENLNHKNGLPRSHVKNYKDCK